MPPFNLNKAPLKEELDYGYMTTQQALESLERVFQRDFIDDPCREFLGKPITYMHDEHDRMRALKHVVMNKEYEKREFIDDRRAKRLHWVKTLLKKAQKSQGSKYWVFSHRDNKHGLRTYIYHRRLRHLVILGPIENGTEYFFITAFQVYGTGETDVQEKYNNRLPDVH